MTLCEHLKILDNYSTITLFDQNGRLIDSECTIKSILKWLDKPVQTIDIKMIDKVENGKMITYINLGITIYVNIPE